MQAFLLVKTTNVRLYSLLSSIQSYTYHLSTTEQMVTGCSLDHSQAPHWTITGRLPAIRSELNLELHSDSISDFFSEPYSDFESEINIQYIFGLQPQALIRVY